MSKRRWTILVGALMLAAVAVIGLSAAIHAHEPPACTPHLDRVAALSEDLTSTLSDFTRRLKQDAGYPCTAAGREHDATVQELRAEQLGYLVEWIICVRQGR